VNRARWFRSAQAVHPLVILNAHAGTVAARRDEAGPAEVTEAFAARGLHPRVVVAEPGRLEGLVRDAVAQRPKVIFVGGGDGTINTAASHLVGTGIPLGVLPLGTLNHFARDLGLPADWRAAVRALADAVPHFVDVGEVNGRIFLNNCSVGLYAEAVRERELLRERHGLRKWWAMALGAWNAFTRLRRMRLSMETDAGAFSARTPFLLVSNNRYTGRVLDGSIRQRLDEGRLWLHTTRAHRRFTMVRLALQALRRRLDEVDHLEIHPVSTAQVTILNRLPAIAVDGELAALEWPLRFRIRPRALRVLAPTA
jgi:diacylglycerol kinase family enzyme